MGMKQIKDTFFIVVGNMICSLGIGTIALRLGLSLGGVSGLAKVLHNVLPVSISILVLAVNLVLFALAYFFVGQKFAMNSFLSVILFPVFLAATIQAQFRGQIPLFCINLIMLSSLI